MKNNNKKKNLPLRFMGRTLTATFTFVSDIFCPLVSPTPSKAPSYLCTVRESPTRSPEFGHKNRGAPSLNHRQSPDPEDERRSGVHFFLPALYPPSFAFCASPAPCSSPRQHPHHRHLPLGARLRASWLTGDDGGAADGQPVCAPPRRLLGEEKAAEGKRDAG